MGKGKSKDGGNDERIEWKEPKELKAFYDLSVVQVLEGKRCGGFLKREGVDAVYHECFEHETGLSIDAGTGKLNASDEWWTQKITACPKAGTFRKKGMPNLGSMDIMFGSTVAIGKNAFCMSGQMPKETTKGSGDSTDSKEFVERKFNLQI
ncbi:uncharacterized protein LOC112010987 [Quercus suber]|uniref:uncharacterized protein LOC112010987 n=1 Tax=Quercus suber TaxID=58331 RepID=UPI000CE1AC5D|nr:uncharacterized protein LOC112010987 [Quercus suber]